MLAPMSSSSRVLTVGDVWPLYVAATDAAGCVTPDDVITATVAAPDGTVLTPVVEAGSVDWTRGGYGAEVVVTAPGRWTARLVGTSGAAEFVAMVNELTGNDELPTIEDVEAYIGTNSWSDEDLQQALDTETLAQFRKCRVPAAFPADLRTALLRRCQFNLAMRKVQLGVVLGDAERETVRIGHDPEVRRLEAPFRRLKMG